VESFTVLFTGSLIFVSLGCGRGSMGADGGALWMCCPVGRAVLGVLESVGSIVMAEGSKIS
jgi:hypothetical protein